MVNSESKVVVCVGFGSDKESRRYEFSHSDLDGMVIRIGGMDSESDWTNIDSGILGLIGKTLGVAELDVRYDDAQSADGASEGPEEELRAGGWTIMD